MRYAVCKLLCLGTCYVHSRFCYIRRIATIPTYRHVMPLSCTWLVSAVQRPRVPPSSPMQAAAAAATDRICRELSANADAANTGHNSTP